MPQMLKKIVIILLVIVIMIILFYKKSDQSEEILPLIEKSLQGITPTKTLSEIEIAKNDADIYFQNNDKYIQVISKNYRINTYRTPKGEQGYQIIENDGNGHVRSTGYGVLAADRTYQDANFGIKSSTSTIQ